MIQHVYERAREARYVEEVLVATDDERICEAVRSFGGVAVMTSPSHPSGTDRIAEAVRSSDFEWIVNIQGDEPLIDINDIINLNNLAIKHNSEIATLACKLETKNIENQNVVKVICDENIEKNKFSPAKQFLRSIENEKSDNIQSPCSL